MWIQTGVTARKRLSLGFDLCDLELLPVTLTFCMDITVVNGNKIHDDTMRGTLWKRCHSRMDRQTAKSVLRAAWSQLNKIENALLCTENFTYVTPYALSMNSHCNECQGTLDNIGWDLAWWQLLPSTLIPSWISNHMFSKVWDEITYPFLNFSGTTVEV